MTRLALISAPQLGAGDTPTSLPRVAVRAAAYYFPHSAPDSRAAASKPSDSIEELSPSVMCKVMGTISSGAKSISGRRSIDSVTATAGGGDTVVYGPLAYISATAVFCAMVRGRRAVRLPSCNEPYSACFGVSLMFAEDGRARQQQDPLGNRHVASAWPSNEVVQTLSPTR